MTQKQRAPHEENHLETIIRKAGPKGLSVNEANAILRDAGISKKGHAKQTFGRMALPDNSGQALSDYVIYNNRIYMKEHFHSLL